MLCRVICPVRQAKAVVPRSTLATRRPAQRTRAVRSEHLDRLASDGPYAAAVAAVLTGALGLVPARDILAAVVAAVLGVCVRGAHREDSGLARSTDPWNAA